ncbi:MAG: nucleotidyltransferase domain-containing protein [Candidatus Gracilibacteria bacterium]
MSRLMNSRRTSYDVHFPYITLQLLDKVRVLLKEFPEIQEAWIFGIHALGNAKPTSDIDIALSGKVNEKLLLQINSILHQKLNISRKTPCIHYESTEIVLRNHIERDGVKIYDCDEDFSDPHAKRKKRDIIL